MSRMKKLLAPCAVLIVILACWLIWSNITISTSRLTFSSAALPPEFDGLRIVHISDTHDCEFGNDNRLLIDAVRAAEPDMILITGDMVDSNRVNASLSVSLGAQLAEIAPTYYSSGNHEALLSDSDYAAFIAGIEAAGITVLDDECVDISRNGATLQLIGLTDVGFHPGSVDEKISLMETRLDNLMGEGFSIVLAHRPEFFDSYAASGADIILSGHAHGGQLRIPFVGGVFAPGQGMFPVYTEGLYHKNDSAMVVSRGLGNSGFPIRINNRPEIVMITLTAQ